MGNRNDYLPLEEASRILGRTVSLLELLGEEEVTAKLTAGKWVISQRDLEKLRANLPKEPETVVHNFLADTPPRKSKRGSRPEPTSKASGTSGARSGQGPRASDTETKASKTQSQSKNNKAKRNQKKQHKNNTRPTLGEVARGRSLYRQITAVDRKIGQELTHYEKAMRENLFYDGATLRKLTSEWQALATEYGRLKDPLGLLPPLPPANINKVKQQEGKVKPSRSKPPKKESLEALRARTAAYAEKARREAESNPTAKWPTERRFWWNEE